MWDERMECEIRWQELKWVETIMMMMTMHDDDDGDGDGDGDGDDDDARWVEVRWDAMRRYHMRSSDGYMIYDMIWYDMIWDAYDSDHPRPCIHACLGTIFRAPWERFDTLRNDSADPAFILWFGLAESFLGHALRPDLKTPSKSSQTRKSSEETCSCFPLIEQLKDRDIEHSSYRAIERSNGRWIERVSGWNIDRSRSSDRALERPSHRERWSHQRF